MDTNHYSKKINVPKLLAKISRPVGLEKYDQKKLHSRIRSIQQWESVNTWAMRTAATGVW